MDVRIICVKPNAALLISQAPARPDAVSSTTKGDELFSLTLTRSAVLLLRHGHLSRYIPQTPAKANSPRFLDGSRKRLENKI
jgi:hypothetical protein